MKYLGITLFLIISFQTLIGQSKLQTYSPIKEFRPDLSKSTEKEINRQTELLRKEELTDSEEKELDVLVRKYGEVVESVWDIIDSGCSWYCGGGNYKVVASSELKSQGTNDYSAKSANNLNYKTAWVEGVSGDGVGEFLDFHFTNKSPRITSIIVSNGYMKSDIAWKANNRIKSLKLYVNGKDFAILSLNDSRTDQKFKVGTLGHNENGSDLVLRFEILEVYQGEKYDDSAITEIYFDGIDVH